MVDSRCRDYRRRYGITLAERDELIAARPFCPICETAFDLSNHKSGSAPVIDHCHETKVIRGVICQRCNRGLGNFKDSTSALKRAIHYLTKGKLVWTRRKSSTSTTTT